MVDDPSRRATEWLNRTYGGLVVLSAPEPFVEGDRTWLFGCQYADADIEGQMLAATVAVPKNGMDPFPVANSDPLDEELNLARPPELGPDGWRWRVNARNCLVATDAAVDRRPVSALAWQPRDEAPGWWERLLAAYFPDAEVATCSSWDEVGSAIAEGGPGTRGAIWLRRQHNGFELTGHLLYTEHHEGQAVILDGQRGSLAHIDNAEVAELVLARFHRQQANGEVITAPWEIAAPDLSSAVDKATRWLDHIYGGSVALVDPDASDETQRGWLFACTTKRFQQTGDWQDQMLDAALVVPKAHGAEPFGLPNPDPWTWFSRWDAGEPDLPDPPAPGAAAWFGPTMQQLGEVISVHEHEHWGGAFTEITNLPVEGRAVVWVRRKDRRGRESVGNLLLAQNLSDGFRLIDSMADGGEPTLDQEPLGLHVIRVE